MASSLPEGLTPAVQAQFRVLQARYVAGLAARWAEITAQQHSSALPQALHRLCGSAATYGFESLGRCARVAEQLAARGASAALTEALEMLKREIEAVEREFDQS